jgi:predicted DNA binding CopG/RHH family protein
MTKKSKASTGETMLPEFRSREEEAAWFDQNRDRLIDLVFRHGKVIPARRIATKQLTMRIPMTDIQRAREIAEKRGVGYQTVLKQAIRDGLKRSG